MQDDDFESELHTSINMTTSNQNDTQKPKVTMTSSTEYTQEATDMILKNLLDESPRILQQNVNHMLCGSADILLQSNNQESQLLGKNTSREFTSITSAGL